ncbi:MAG: BspA family leucine-rich repeat surface protein, partial [Prevotella sp.]
DNAGNKTYAGGIFRIVRFGPEMKQPQHYAVFSPDSTLMTIYCDTLMAERATENYCCLMPENGEPAAYSLIEIPVEEAVTGMKRTSIFFAEPGPVICKVKEVKWDYSFSKAYPRNIDYWFYNAISLKSINCWSLNTDKVTSMKYTFANCCSLEDMPTLYTSNVTDMNHMFLNCDNLNNVRFNNLHNWITDKVTDMSSMFEGCRALTDFDAGKMNTDNVTDMSGMFKDCRSIERLDLSTINTKKVTNAAEMFYRASSLRWLNLGGNDFANADMTNAFRRTASNYTDSVCRIYVNNAFNHEVLTAVPGADYSILGNGKVCPVLAHLTVGPSHIYTTTGELACNVLVERTFNVGEWQTLVLPFEVGREQLETVFGKGSLVARMSSFTGDTLYFNTVSTLSSLKPAIIKPTKAADWPIFEDINVSPFTPGDEDETGANIYDQVGEDTTAFLIGLLGESYQSISAMTPYNTLCPSPLMAQKETNDVSLYNTEAYFFMYTKEAENSESEESPSYNYNVYYDIPIVVNGEGTDTGIKDIVKTQYTDTTSPRYNLSGQRVGSSYKGVVIQNGYKIVRK